MLSNLRTFYTSKINDDKSTKVVGLTFCTSYSLSTISLARPKSATLQVSSLATKILRAAKSCEKN